MDDETTPTAPADAADLAITKPDPTLDTGVDVALDEALEESFPASDPPASSNFD